MADNLTPEQRKLNMSHIKSVTPIEDKVRKYLFSRGFRYRKNVRKLPGKPDIVLPKYKTVIFINGCFWHQHPFCRRASSPKSNTEYWSIKLKRNVANDKKHYEELEQMGWHVIVIWECELKKKNFEETLQRTINELTDRLIEIDTQEQV